MFRGWLGALCVTLASFLATHSLWAQTAPGAIPPGYKQSQVHQPWSANYLGNTQAIRGGFGSSWSNTSIGFVGAPGTSFAFGTWNPWWGGQVWGRPIWGTPGWGAPVWGAPVWGGGVWARPGCFPGYGWPIALPPAYLPAEQIYGPAAAWRMIDAAVPRAPLASSVAASVNVQPQLPAGPLVIESKKKSAPKSSNQAVRARARRLVESGDRAFLEQNYTAALGRFRRAAEMTPDVAEARFREAQTLVALERYREAADAVRQGLEIDPHWPGWPLDLDRLYGRNQVAKTAHLDALATAALDQPSDGDLMFLVGVELFLDGQRDRSRKFLERAGQLADHGGEFVEAFLDELPAERVAGDQPGPDGKVDL